MSYLLDTCVVSELVKTSPEPKVLEWLKGERVCYLSSLTIGELRKGIELVTEPVRKRKLETWLTDKVLPEFSRRIFNVDIDIAERWGRLYASLQSQGVALSVIDGLLAATAIHHGLQLVTRNQKDFVRTGVTLVNPWT